MGTRAPTPVLALPNQRWSVELCATRPSSLLFESVHYQAASGRRFCVLNVVDDVTRECLAAVLDTSISGRHVVRELTELIAQRGRMRDALLNETLFLGLAHAPGDSSA